MIISIRPLIILVGAALAACNNDSGESTDSPTGSTSTSTTDGTGTTDDTTTDSPTGGDSTTMPPTTGETTDGEPLTRVEKILAALDVAMYECPERIWPDVEANYRARQVLLASESENRAWVWNYQQGDGEPPRVTEGPLDTLPPEWTAFFNINQLGGALTLGISLDGTQETNEAIMMNGGVVWPDFATALIFHEGFHFLSDQNDWNVGNGSRSAPYPEPWEPRYLRAQLLRSLLAEVHGEDGLAAAAHWRERLLSEHADEMAASRRYDCTEGSAEYASLMMSALAELGCDAADEELLALAVSHLADGVFLGGDTFDSGREFYDLGVLSGLLLRRDAVPGWELKVEDGDPPADLLLADVAPAAQPDDGALQADAQAAVDARNMVVGAEIEPMLAAMQDPQFTRVVVSMNWIAGSFNVGGFYYLAEDPNQSEVFLTFSATMDPPSSVPIAIEGLTVLAGVATPCVLSGGNAIVLTVPTADIALAGNLATTTNPKVQFTDLEVELTMDDDNLSWLCPTDAGGSNGAPAPQPELELHTLRAPGHGQKAVLRPRAASRVGHGQSPE
ncbi:hypothetical protein SAMN02745121_03923 [Nannocystis exedens]|uniref:Lipoprotein n=1 Tax=Nannocystis exedens TaxID=54 RepID=A0A1I1ZRR1_9BACT|nr:hypothetical protein [Nannocystis exedens]PCC75351.1 hypothetical protein NAEX_08461 [Nannocystis exedens]SFE34305.1 hypothetical protein SAMN02745121_03923 [Nannocystis exedens]